MANKQQRTILIVDDCLEDREVYKRYLQRDVSFSYVVLEAESGIAALELWQTHNIDVVLLDYLLPDINGVELLEELSQQGDLSYPPVVMLTGQGDESVAVKAMKAGASDYIVKARIRPEALRLAINSAIEKSKLNLQLRASQEHLQLALETAMMGTWEWNLYDNSFVCSQLLSQILDIPENACLSSYESFLAIIHPEDRYIVDRAIKYAISHKTEYQLEFRHPRQDGNIAWINVRGKIYEDGGKKLSPNLENQDGYGKALRVISTFTDITIIKREEEEKQQFFLKERLVYQIAQQVRQSLDLTQILETTVDKVRNFLDCDRVLIFQFTPDWNGVVLTESVSADFAPILGIEIYDPCFASDWVTRYQQGRVQNIGDIHNSNLTPCHTDFLAELQVKANLVVPILKSETLWGLLIAHQCTTPRQWQPLEVNLLQELATQVGIAIQQSLLFQQVQIELSERKQAQVALQESWLREKEIREEAETANRIKDEFLAVLSHELRSPLNPILGWSKILLSGRKLGEERQKEALKIIERNAKVQSQLIEDLLDISRILQGKLKLESESINLVSIILSALETVRLSAEIKNIQLKFVVANITAKTPNSDWLEIINTESSQWSTKIAATEFTNYFIIGDAARLQQIIWNLLTNAVKFTPKQGEVTVKLQSVDGTAKIIVTDTGRGIDKDFLPHVFSHFRQADSTTTRKFGGLGLGLAIVRYLVEMHGGSAAANSPGKDLGATFTVDLPLQELDQNQDNQQNAHNHKNPSENLQGIRILVVEDEPDSRDYIGFILEQDGAQVTKVKSAMEALQVFTNLQFDLVVSDIGMPEMDGYMLLREIRAIKPEAGGKIPAIALTAYAGEIDRKQALDVGFQCHVTKPVEPDNLIKKVMELTALRKDMSTV